MRRVHIHITGIVQGVGMRPFVYREAVAHGIAGWVLNAGDGVHIEAHAESDAIDAFVHNLHAHAPAASRINAIEVVELDSYTADASTARKTTPAPTFRIIASEDETAHTTLVSPDIATCDDCLRELFDPTDHRYHYPFINCTNCGPRFTIIRDLPYDRAKTSMDAFPMCPTCAAEYADPLDRRFHAQPDACFACGPHITWREVDVSETSIGDTREHSDAIIEHCAELLANGGIVAIKGLGGFHLACRADSESAVAELRRRKRRSNKALAVMVRDLTRAQELCEINETEKALLAGSIRPIVLLKRHKTTPARPAVRRLEQGAHNPPLLDSASAPSAKTPSRLAPSVAFDLPELGIMLPYTPLQHLLLAACEARDISALVMTSGNVSEEPIEVDDGLAWEHLVAGGLADALLGNDRAILSRYDDSVVRVADGKIQLVRRARGYAPQPLGLPAHAQAAVTSGAPTPCILACGPEQKATLALTREEADGSASCFVSQHIGDLENASTLDAWHTARMRLENLFDLHPAVLACDAHPGYLSSQWAREQVRTHGLPLIETQHHHAHIAAVLAEAAARDEADESEPVIGIALDGTGAGATYTPKGGLRLDGTIWGGEILTTSLSTFQRCAHLQQWRLPGGAASVRDPRRNAFSLLASYDLLDHPGTEPLPQTLNADERTVTKTMIERGINSPLTSSMGRLLDAIAALLGICTRATYEGEPAILLEAAATRALEHGVTPNAQGAQTTSTANPGATSNATHEEALAQPIFNRCAPQPSMPSMQTSPRAISAEPLLVHLLDGIAAGADADGLALIAHLECADLIASAAIDAARAAGITTVALSGGVFMNRILLRAITEHLEASGLTVLTPRSLPHNDGCIAYGQAAIARARLAQAR